MILFVLASVDSPLNDLIGKLTLKSNTANGLLSLFFILH